jgi:mRNA-degrading endonuclease RelE of RelBE toxin-antitoxin system
MIEYEESDEFKKDFKKLVKRFPSLLEDLATVKKAVIELRHLKNINNLSTFEIPGFGTEELSFWKIKKFACKSLKGRGNKSGVRVVYGWCQKSNKVVFMEIYFKGDKENEDKERIKKFKIII